MPTIIDVKDILETSGPGQWYIVPSPGPTYLDAFGMTSKGIEQREHTQRAVYGEDVCLGIAWGMPCEERMTWEESPFPDKTVQNQYVDVLYCGMLIDRIIVTSADGGRVLLPPATLEVVTAGPGDYEHDIVVGEHASSADSHLTWLIHELSGRPGAFDANLRMAQISTTEPPDDDPHTETW
jgi:hypothetical protein